MVEDVNAMSWNESVYLVGSGAEKFMTNLQNQGDFDSERCSIKCTPPRQDRSSREEYRTNAIRVFLNPEIARPFLDEFRGYSGTNELCLHVSHRIYGRLDEIERAKLTGERVTCWESIEIE